MQFSVHIEWLTICILCFETGYCYLQHRSAVRQRQDVEATSLATGLYFLDHRETPDDIYPNHSELTIKLTKMGTDLFYGFLLPVWFT